MGKELREHDGPPQPTVPFPALRDTPMCTRVLDEAAAKLKEEAHGCIDRISVIE